MPRDQRFLDHLRAHIPKSRDVGWSRLIRWEARSQPEFREEQTGPDRVAERSVVALRRVMIAEQRGLSSRSTQKQQEPGRLTRVYQPQNGSAGAESVVCPSEDESDLRTAVCES
jgi:hypothetical protein